MRNTLIFAVDDHVTAYDQHLTFKLLRATGLAKELGVADELCLPGPADDGSDFFSDARNILIHHFGRLPTDQQLTVMLTHQQNIETIADMSDFAVAAVDPASPGTLSDRCELSNDGAEIAIDTRGATSKIIVIFNQDIARAYAVDYARYSVSRHDAISFGGLDFTPLHLNLEAVFRLPAGFFAEVKDTLKTTGHFAARERLLGWFWGKAQDQLADPIVSRENHQALAEKQRQEKPDQLIYSAGTEDEMGKLLQWIVDINAHIDDSEFIRRPHERAYGRVIVASAGTHGPIHVRTVNLAPRMQRIALEVVAAFGPRGQKGSGYATNRHSSRTVGGIKKFFGEKSEANSSHELIEAIGGLTAFLGQRGYRQEQIDAMLDITVSA